MSKITIDVNDDNLDKVLLILNNLKDGLILNVDVEKKASKYNTAYKPKTNKVVYENEQMTEQVSGKYLNAASYKKRLKK